MADDLDTRILDVRIAAAKQAALAKQTAATLAQDPQGAATAPPAETPTAGGLFPFAKAMVFAVPKGAAQTAATLLGAPGEAISGITRMAGFPNAANAISNTVGIPGQSNLLGVPQMEAGSGVNDLPLIPRMVVRGTEMAGGGAPVSYALSAGARAAAASGKVLPEVLAKMADDPAAFAKLNAIMDASGGATGEAAATAVQALAPQHAEFARFLGTLVGAAGGPAALRMTSAMGRSALRRTGLRSQTGLIEDAARAKQSALDEAHAILGDMQATDPHFIEQAHRRINEAVNLDLPKPPIGSASGSPQMLAEQQGLLGTIPGAADQEALRQAASDAAIRSKMTVPGEVPSAEAIGGPIINAKAEMDAQHAAQVAQAQNQLRLAEAVRAKEKQAFEGVKAVLGSNLDDAVDQRISAAQQRANDAVDALGPSLSEKEAGDIYVSELDNQRTEFRTQANKAYDEVLNGTDNRQVPTANVKDVAAAELIPPQNMTPETYAASVPRFVKEIAESKVESLTPKQLQALRSQALNELRVAQGGGNPNPAATRKISNVLDAIDNEFEKLAEGDAPIAGLKLVNQWYRQGKEALVSNPRFRDVGRGLTAKGGAPLDPSEVARRFLRSNTTTGAQEAMTDFHKAYGQRLGVQGDGITIPDSTPSAIAERALDQHTIGAMREAVTDVDGNVKSLKLRQWVRDHRIALEQRPELLKKMNSAAEAQKLVTDDIARIKREAARVRAMEVKAAQNPADIELQDRVNQAKRDLADTQRSVLDQRKKFDNEFAGLVDNPPQKVAEILDGKSGLKARLAIRSLVTRLGGDEGAKWGLRRVVWEHLAASTEGSAMGVTGNPLTDPARFRAMLKKHGDLLGELYSPEWKQYLGTLADQAETNLKAGTSLPSETRLAKPKGHIANLVPYLTSRMYSVARGVVSPHYVATEGLARVLANKLDGVSNAHIRQIMHDSLYDLDAYQAIAGLAKHPNSDAAFRRFSNYGRAVRGLGLLTANRAQLREQNQRRFGAQGR